MWTAAKVMLFTLWSLVLAYFLVSVAERIATVHPVATAKFFLAVLAMAALLFPCLWFAFRSLAVEEISGPGGRS